MKLDALANFPYQRTLVRLQDSTTVDRLATNTNLRNPTLSKSSPSRKRVGNLPATVSRKWATKVEKGRPFLRGNQNAWKVFIIGKGFQKV